MRRRRDSLGALTPIMRALGRRLRQMRIEAGLTQESVAQSIDVSTQAVRNWEAGRHEPTVLHVFMLARLYGVSIMEIQEPLFTADNIQSVTSTSVPLQGFLLAGTSEHSETSVLGSVPVPEFVLRDHPNMFTLRVVGTSLESSGIGDGDLVFVDPDSSLAQGDDVFVFSVGAHMFGRRVEYVAGQARYMGIDESERELSREEAEYLGKVVWHLRRM